MRMKVKDVRRLIRENYAREIPQYAIDDACSAAIKMKNVDAAKHCRNQLEHHFKVHINSTSVSQSDLYYKISKMHSILQNMEEEIKDLKNLKDDLKDIVDQHVRRFLFI